MQTCNVLKAGVIADGITSCAAALQALFDAHKKDTVFFFPAGQYYLREAVRVQGMENVTVCGDGATIITHFDPCDDPSTYNHAFLFSDCRELTLEGFTFTTDAPVNTVGTVIGKNPKEHTYDVLIDPEFPVTGFEHLYGSDTVDDEGSPDYALETYDKIEKTTVTDENGKERLKITGVVYTVIGDHTIRVQLPDWVNYDRVHVGHRIMYRYLIYGNGTLSFADCHDVTVRHIEIARSNSFGAHVSPRSSNFTFEDFNIRSPKGSKAVYASNADGIHILGLSGYLKMKNCHFDGLGDDALNIHSIAGEIAAISDDGKHMHFTRGNDRGLPQKWAQSGDVILVYDKETLHVKGRLTLSQYADNGDAEIAAEEGTCAVGDILANDAFFAAVTIENCSVRNTRARGFLLQTRNVLVDNCHIYGMALPAIIISPDINYWYEVGPAENVEIRNCTFEKCSWIVKASNVGAVVVKTCHDDKLPNMPTGVHHDIRFINNTFKHCGNSGIFVASTDGVTVRGNRFSELAQAVFDRSREGLYHAVYLYNSSHFTVQDNESDTPDKMLFTEGCEENDG